MLVAFFGPRGSPEMMSEILREGLRRLQASHNQENSQSKIRGTVEGWGNVESYELDGDQLSLNFLEYKTGAKFILREAQSHTDGDLYFGGVLDQVNNQEEKLNKLNIHHFVLSDLILWTDTRLQKTNSAVLLLTPELVQGAEDQ